ncbi:hypothetical protein HOY80DRAFT_572997 [Tuber brumale]|nr:hypothetical protein HOY80DRAFT_572997 [Tuber brumale]
MLECRAKPSLFSLFFLRVSLTRKMRGSQQTGTLRFGYSPPRSFSLSLLLFGWELYFSLPSFFRLSRFTFETMSRAISFSFYIFFASLLVPYFTHNLILEICAKEKYRTG